MSYLQDKLQKAGIVGEMKYERKILSMDDAYKIANFDKVKEENTMLKSDNNILKESIRNKDKQYLKIIEERDKEIKRLRDELYNKDNKQISLEV